MSSKLDQQQIIQTVFDETSGRLKVDAELTANIIPFSSLEVGILAADDNIAIRNSNNNNELLINSDGSINLGNFPSSQTISNFPSVYPVTQSTSPWTVNGTVTANAGTGTFQTNITNSTLSVTQSTSPWIISGSVNAAQSGTWSTGRTWTLLNSTDSVNIGNFPSTQNVSITNSSLPVTQSGSWTTSISNFPSTQAVTQSTTPWIISGTVTSNIGTTNGLALDSSLSTIDTDLKASQPRKIQDGLGNALTSQINGAQRALDIGINVSGTQIDPRVIRALTSSDIISAVQSGTWNIGTLSTITNVVHVDDNAGSLTVDNNGTFAVQATQSGTWNLNNISGTISLPTGASTSALQTTANTSLSSIDTKLTSPLTSKISDGTDTALVTINGEQKTVDGLRNGGVYGSLSIPTSGTAIEAKVGGSRLTNRKMLTIYAASSGLFWGLDNSVTTSSGIPLNLNQVMSFSIDPDSTFQIWLVGNANSLTANIVECP